MEEDYTALLCRIEQLEKKLEQEFLRFGSGGCAVVQKETGRPLKKLRSGIPEEVEQAVKSWRSIIASMQGLSGDI